MIRTGRKARKGSGSRSEVGNAGWTRSNGLAAMKLTPGNGGGVERQTERATNKSGVELKRQAGIVDPAMVASREAVVVGESKAVVRFQSRANLASRCIVER